MKFSSEHHNWDMTVAASSHLVVAGRLADGHHSFSAFTGSMVLAVAGLESFLNSVGYSISKSGCGLNFEKFEKKPIGAKVDFILQQYKIEIDRNERPYVTISEAVVWRHSLVHSKPSYVEEVQIGNMSEVAGLPVQHSSQSYQYAPYENHVNEANADRFNRDVVQIIELIKDASGIDPRAQCTYIT